ncbi:DUF2239 family protein [Methylorubrum extorquens]|uniref:DUF2239 family protein n=1 Tax=Methylorubrum extorquens TaxID=408 RepID=UPI0001590667|nr:DUF2239 family protein [Methylorubrum extorquens]ABY29162.1 conserved hypothetical protein [Methylorubrum extorquens PA1]KQP91379.1 hypothetical protein ASF55_02050 [Methylobacterium sp. Leaf119]WIU40512.1 DUF2239 family protein [Methylorubrum extorquens]
MADDPMTTFTAFVGVRRLASGRLIDVALAVKERAAEEGEPILAFDDRSGAIIDLDLRGTEVEITARFAELGNARDATGSVESRADPDGAPRSRGRPKLGVIAREVTLLPRQWEWLASQPGGASQALRRLVDEARRADGGQTRTKAAREAAYRFLSALAGDLPGFEEAIRALFAGDAGGFADRMMAWPPDIRAHALKLAALG